MAANSDENLRMTVAEATKRREELTKSQHPFAIVVGCADSRVPPEIVFDQGLGDLFVLRVAGNVIDDHSLGSNRIRGRPFGCAPDRGSWASALRGR